MSLFDWMNDFVEKHGFDASGASPVTVEDDVTFEDETVAPEEDGGGDASAHDYARARFVQGGGGYLYAQWPDGKIVIMRRPSGDCELLVDRGTKAWDAITEEIGGFDGSAEEDPGGGSGSGEDAPAAPPASTEPEMKRNETPEEEWNRRAGEYSAFALQVGAMTGWPDSGYTTEIKVMYAEVKSIQEAVDKGWYESALTQLNRSQKMIAPIQREFEAFLEAGGETVTGDVTSGGGATDSGGRPAKIPATDIPETDDGWLADGGIVSDLAGGAEVVVGVADAFADGAGAVGAAGALGTAAAYLGVAAPFLQFAGFAAIIEKRGDDLYQAVMSRGFAYGVVAEATGTKIGSPPGGGTVTKKAFKEGLKLGRAAFQKAAAKAPSDGGGGGSTKSLEQHLNDIHLKVIKGLFDESFLGIVPAEAPMGAQERGCKLKWPGPSWSGTCVMP